MILPAFEAVARALYQGGVKYLVVGGLAVNAHGYLRLTADIDLVIALDADNIMATFTALGHAGYRPSVPISAAQFADAGLRQRWIQEKGMQVLNFFGSRHPEASVDVFVYEPFEFRREYEAALAEDLIPGLPVRFVSIPTLIRMKDAAGRPRDRDDVQHLRWILESEGRNE